MTGDLNTTMIEKAPLKIRLLVVESFDLVRIGLRALFENHTTISMVAEANRIDNLFSLAVEHKPDVILVDLQLTNGDCAVYLSKLLNACPNSKVLAFSEPNNERVYLQMLRSGVAGIIGKHYSCKLLLKAIYAVHAGQILYDSHTSKLIRQERLGVDTSAQIATRITASHPPKLSSGERQIAHLACKGLSAKEISMQLLITEKTVRNQLSIIYKKVGVRKQIELYLKASLYNYFQ